MPEVVDAWLTGIWYNQAFPVSSMPSHVITTRAHDHMWYSSEIWYTQCADKVEIGVVLMIGLVQVCIWS